MRVRQRANHPACNDMQIAMLVMAMHSKDNAGQISGAHGKCKDGYLCRPSPPLPLGNVLGLLHCWGISNNVEALVEKRWCWGVVGASAAARMA
jgi:hypothetical protein